MRVARKIELPQVERKVKNRPSSSRLFEAYRLPLRRRCRVASLKQLGVQRVSRRSHEFWRVCKLRTSLDKRREFLVCTWRRSALIDLQKDNLYADMIVVPIGGTCKRTHKQHSRTRLRLNRIVRIVDSQRKKRMNAEFVPKLDCNLRKASAKLDLRRVAAIFVCVS